MQTETVFDLRYNVAAMYIAILRDDVATPEQAFSMLEGKSYRLAKEDVEDIIAMRDRGMEYKDIAKIYGYSESGIKSKVYRHRKKTRSGGNQIRSKAK